MRNTKRIALLGILTSLIYVGRLTFSFLPNVQPMTTILILITLTLGLKEGLVVTILSILMSNLSLGMGVWTIAQIVSFSCILLLISLLNKVFRKLSLFNMAIICGFTGLMYGLIISLVQAPFFGWAAFIPYYISGFPFDLFHAFGNYCFYLILAPILKPILLKQDKKLMN